MLNIDATLHPDDEGRLLSKIEAEVDWLHSFAAGDLNGHGMHILEQMGINSRLETDQLFDNTNITAGVTSWTAVNGSFIQDVGHALCFFGEPPKSIPSPIFNLSYELVEKVKLDDDADARDIEETTDRVRLQFYWSIMFAHEIPVFWNASSTYDLHGVINTAVAYDFRNSEVVPDINLSLELSPSKPATSIPSIVFTYADGKTSTKFENYDEFLGGLKWRW
jgi:hypothetical protein